MFRAILETIVHFFRGGVKSGSRREVKTPLPKICYPSLVIKTDRIANQDIGQSDFFCQQHNNKYKWVMFRCPCHCGDVITLSLQPIHTPSWKLSLSEEKRPTLYPSVWRDSGCYSHFWVKDGRVFWCLNTGNDPRL